jgi:hypothetical protein
VLAQVVVAPKQQLACSSSVSKLNTKQARERKKNIGLFARRPLPPAREMSAMSRAIRACGGAASRRSLSVAASKEAPAVAAAAAVVAGRKAGRDRGEDGSRVQWVFLGCPGVGKGTYAGRLSRLLGVPHIATGDLVRDALASQDPLSKQVLLLALRLSLRVDFFEVMFRKFAYHWRSIA